MLLSYYFHTKVYPRCIKPVSILLPYCYNAIDILLQHCFYALLLNIASTLLQYKFPYWFHTDSVPFLFFPFFRPVMASRN